MAGGNLLSAAAAASRDYTEKLVTFAQLHPILFGTAVFTLFIIYRILDNYNVLPSNSVINNIPDVGRGNWLVGHFPQCFSFDPEVFARECYDKYGPVHRISGLFGRSRIVIQDPKALSHLIKNAYDYPKTNIVRGEIGRALGHGVLFEEGDNHRRQRKILNPAFAQANIRELAPAFTALAIQSADRLEEIVDKSTHEITCKLPNMPSEKHGRPVPADEEDGVVIEIYHWVFRLTLDVIGLCGFGRNYGAIHNEEQGMAKSFALWSANEEQDFSIGSLFLRIITVILPPSVRKIPILTTERLEILENAKADLEIDTRAMFKECKTYLDKGGELGERKKDLFTVIMKANFEALGKDKLSDEETFAQIRTFIAAGHETSATGLAWALHLLSKNQPAQDKLRAEIHEAQAQAELEGLEFIDPQVIANLPYLDAVLRESLRCRPPIPGRSFVAQKDDIMPLSKPVTLLNGRVITEIPVKKGQEFYTWHVLTNKLEDAWGADWNEFKPERWLEDPASGKKGDLGNAALWSQSMTFFGGPRACIGYRFALAEMKSVLSVFIDRFQFHDVGVKFSARTLIVMRPALEDLNGKVKNQMPMRVTKVKRA